MTRHISLALVVLLTTLTSLLADSRAEKIASKPDAWFTSEEAQKNDEYHTLVANRAWGLAQEHGHHDNTVLRSEKAVRDI